MAVSSVPPSSVPPPGSGAFGQQSVLLLAQRKNGVGHGQVIGDIQAPPPSAPPAISPVAKIGSKVDKVARWRGRHPKRPRPASAGVRRRIVVTLDRSAAGGLR